MPDNETPQPKYKQYFDVKVEALVPTIYVYRVYAEDERTALQQITLAIKPTTMKQMHNLKRLINATVYKAGSTITQLTKKYL